MTEDKRFIEDTFPIKEVSEAGAKEKNIRNGHISTLHIWWARRPLSTSRATAYASLIKSPKTEEDKDKIRNFIADYSKWENTTNSSFNSYANQQILLSNDNKAPKVLDPFGGGGSIPLEALRLGCETYSNDYNPIAVIIQKCTLEFPQKYGRKISRIKESKGSQKEIEVTSEVNKLCEDVSFWANRLSSRAKEILSRFYPDEQDGSIPVGYIWSNTIPCQNQTCGIEIPLLRHYWLSKMPKKQIALYPSISQEKILSFKLIGTGYSDFPEGFNAEEGTVSRAVVTCPVCGNVISDKETRRLFQSGKSKEKMMVVVLNHPKKRGKHYRLPTTSDHEIFRSADNFLNETITNIKDDWGINVIPDEELPFMSGVFNVPLYGMTTWGSLFNNRQKLTYVILIKVLKDLKESLYKNNIDEEYAKVICTYLALAISRLSGRLSKLAYWFVQGEKIQPTFGRQALGMVWDYIELNPFNNSSGGWDNNMYDILNFIESMSSVSNTKISITNTSATNLPYPDDFFDAVFTDPPYYNSVPYADLSDYFYVWLKRAIGDLYPDLFSTPLAPKKNEITEMAGWDPIRYAEKDKIFFEKNLKKAFQEIFRVLKKEGISIIVYAHKSTSGWETVINALLDSGLVITASYPLNTEMQTRARANESASLSSSIYIVARKIERHGTGFYNEVKDELKTYLDQKLETLWEEGITGADFFIAAIGAGIEVFGKYEKVIDYEGNVKRANVLLDDVREVAMQYTIKHILHNGFSGEVSELTKFYVIWRFSFGEAKTEFDEANKLGRSIGIDLSQEWGQNGFIKKEKEFIRVLGPNNRKIEDLNQSDELIDILHLTLLLWEKGKKDQMMQVLANTGFGHSEAFYRVAQAVSESLGKLTPDSREKKLLDGFLGSKERIRTEVASTPKKRFSQLDLDF